LLSDTGLRTVTGEIEPSMKAPSPLKRALKIAVFLALTIASLEIVSSYVLFRYYAATKNEYHPTGFATSALIERLLIRFHGLRKTVQITVDHYPLYDTDDQLGFKMLPGSYLIDETFDSLAHNFRLTLNERGERITGYSPNQSKRRIVITGDSAMFGWGLENEETVPWLLQARLPDYHVQNLSMTSYSTIQTLMQLKRLDPQLGPDDTVVLVYHPVTNQFNVATNEIIKTFTMGYEMQSGDPERIKTMQIPFGKLGPDGTLVVSRYDMACQFGKKDPGCAHADPTWDDAMKVTERAFDEILELHPGHVFVALSSGELNDPVVTHLKGKGAIIVDARIEHVDRNGSDIIPTDSHAGPFYHHVFYRWLLKSLIENRAVDASMTGL
jgi:hypothetical protein